MGGGEGKATHAHNLCPSRTSTSTLAHFDYPVSRERTLTALMPDSVPLPIAVNNALVHSAIIDFTGYSQTGLCAKYTRSAPIDGHSECTSARVTAAWSSFVWAL